MNILKYVKNNSMAQMRNDWNEYKNLKTLVKQAEKDMAKVGRQLVSYCDTNAGHKISCINLYVNFVDLLQSQSCIIYEEDCPGFTLAYDMKKCQNKTCSMWNAYNTFYDAKQKLNQLELEYKKFWANKLAHVK